MYAGDALAVLALQDELADVDERSVDGRLLDAEHVDGVMVLDVRSHVDRRFAHVQAAVSALQLSVLVLDVVNEHHGASPPWVGTSCNASQADGRTSAYVSMQPRYRR